MLQKFVDYITEKKLWGLHSKILAAVSGGLDSVVMCELMHQAGINFAIAHCNFQLRGEESDEDEKFVKALSEKYNVPFFVKHFDTQKHAEDNNVSTQMAARELRYSWFREIVREEKFDYVATAHHKNDSLETVLLNLTKGTGIAGLHGISPKKDILVRPLLFASREEVRDCANSNRLPWREDSSNKSVKYQRNLIRHEVVPVLKKINPNLENTIVQSMDRISAVERIFHKTVRALKQRFYKEKDDQVFLGLGILQEEGAEVILYEILHPFNFSWMDSLTIVGLAEAESGKKVLSPTHVITKDREFFIISRRKDSALSEGLIFDNDTIYSDDDIQLSIQVISEKPVITSAQDVAMLDFHKLEFPLVVRGWQKGDVFYPLGMNRKKKVSDFLIDNKIPVPVKEKVKVLVSGEEIVWIIGYRISERCKISEGTRKTVKFQLIDKNVA